MKRLSELGISHAPWKACGDGCVISANGYDLTDGDGMLLNNSDASLISAAPEMYSVLWDFCFGESMTVNCAKCGGNDHGDGIEHCSKTCPFYKARAALAKANGVKS